LSFTRELVEQIIRVAVYGAVIAALVKVFGIERSIVLPSAVGFGVGWCACWLQTSWFGTPKGDRRPGEAGLTRALSQRHELDAGIRQPYGPDKGRDKQ
jgi:hypothetical protein